MALNARLGRTCAESDLEWLLASGDAAMGFRAQGYEPSSAGVWDEDRIARAHLSHLEDAHRFRVDRHARVRELFNAMTSHSQEVAIAAYTPRAWSERLVTACRHKRRLVGIVVCLPELLELHRARMKREPKDGAALIEWLECEATTPDAKATFALLTAAAIKLLDAALAEYTELARKRDEAELEAYVGVTP